MTIPVTKEMYRLFDIFYPWIDFEEIVRIAKECPSQKDCPLKEGAPKEAIEAKKQFDILYDELYQIELNFQLHG